MGENALPPRAEQTPLFTFKLNGFGNFMPTMSPIHSYGYKTPSRHFNRFVTWPFVVLKQVPTNKINQIIGIKLKSYKIHNDCVRRSAH